MKKLNPSYIGQRNDIVKLIPNNVSKILDIGCSIGTLGRQLKSKNNAYIAGIEKSRAMGKEASKYLDKVFIGDIEDGMLNNIDDHEFDCVILADVLEHLKNPWKIVSHCYRILKNDGLIIASIPNVKHYSTIYNLVFKGYWPYRDRGIHDKTHLRFFTKKNVRKLFEQENFKKNRIVANYRIIEKPSKINKYSRILSIFPLRSFFVFQYIAVYQKSV